MCVGVADRASEASCLFQDCVASASGKKLDSTQLTRKAGGLSLHGRLQDPRGRTIDEGAIPASKGRIVSYRARGDDGVLGRVYE